MESKRKGKKNMYNEGLPTSQIFQPWISYPFSVIWEQRFFVCFLFVLNGVVEDFQGHFADHKAIVAKRDGLCKAFVKQ